MKTLLLFLALTTAPLMGQTWQKIVSEGAAQASSPVVTLPAGTVYRFGFGTKFCDPVTTTGKITLTVWYARIVCTVNGVSTIDPDPNVQKELDVQETAVAQPISYVVGGKTTTVTVPALPPPPSTTYSVNCPATFIGTASIPTGATSGTLTGTTTLNAGCTLVKQ
jgi:hypothetical protein